ncbi:aminotransferase class III-fold pyridoxal phosphate-dependent enzyme [Candidatus Kuenenia stuttgartensis]|uniref:aminotransferase class III-fold pyridoxal phosphate-dependent enzyme n=1 Tax=Kuenenia stuttgartiensis TaxID=174633 RepID=UPI00146DB230
MYPGGNGLLSKRPEGTTDIWPTYFSRAKGVEIWDLDGNRYIDMAQMGIGTAILGYCDEDVNNAVKDAVNNSVNTTLNAPEEVYLAKKDTGIKPFCRWG